MKILVVNKKINLYYSIYDKYEAGIVLQPSEVKSLCVSNASLDDAYVIINMNNEIYLLNANIAPYTLNKMHPHMPTRKRKLLMHKEEIIKLAAKIKKGKFALIPSKIYFVKSKIKVEVCMCKSKNSKDKRIYIKDKETRKEIKNVINKFSK